MSERPSWGETFMDVARILSKRSTCSRRQVGAVLVQDNRIISTGYNGAPPGKMHCTDGGCPRGKFTHDEIPPNADYNDYPCVAVHAEANALLRAGHAASKGGVLYVTTEPCQQCWNLIEAAEIREVIWIDGEFVHVKYPGHNPDMDGFWRILGLPGTPGPGCDPLVQER